MNKVNQKRKFYSGLQIALIIICIHAFLPQSAESQIQNDTLAILANRIISSTDFIIAYREKLVTLGLSDTYEMRCKYLQNLFYDEILIQQARKKGYDKTAEASSEKKRIETQELLNAYSLKNISPSVKITEKDLKELFIKMNTKLKVSHLYASTKEEADKLYSELLKGISFDSLAQKVFYDPYLRENSGSLGYITIDEMDAEFEKAAFNLKLGEVSAPVKTVYGYSIIRLEDIKQNPFLTETEFTKALGKLKSLARKRKYEEAAKNLTLTLRNNLDVHFNQVLISKLYKLIEKDSSKKIVENDQPRFSPTDLKTPVVFYATRNWKLEKVINELRGMKERQKRWIHSEENLKDVIAGLIMREYITKKAVDAKLDSSASFKKNVRHNFDTYLLTKIENEIQKNIVITSDSIKSYYERNRNLFVNPAEIRLSSILVDNELMSDSIKSILKSGKRFEETARNYSIQRLTAERGGDIGFFQKKELGNLGDELFKLSLEEWNGPYQDGGKYLFLKCTGKKEAYEKSYEQAATEITKMLTSLEWFSKRTQYADSLKNKIDCKIFFQKLTQIKI